MEDEIAEPDFPIDIVYTWVDQSDPSFRAVLEAHLPADARTNRNTMSRARFKCHGELRYSLRSIERFAPWVNHVYIVTNGLVPGWLADHPKVSIVPHAQILEPQFLPTFNSHVIESALHRIPGLSEHYIYFNDDVMLLRPMARNDAFTGGGLACAFMTENRIAGGSPTPGETATEWGAKNARDLLQREWGHSFNRRFAHLYHAQRRSVAADCERLFAADYARFRRNRFRQPDDVLCCSFLHPYAGYVTGRTLLANETGWYVGVREMSARRAYAQILADMQDPQGLPVACVNDYIPLGGGVTNYAEPLIEFLETCFPGRSSFELAEGQERPSPMTQAAE